MKIKSGKFKNKYRIASTRMQGWDYAAVGWYFVTICARERTPFFAEVHEGRMRQKALGDIAEKYWLQIPDHIPQVALDEFIIMPDHVHGIIVINATGVVETQGGVVETPVETQHAASLQDNGKSRISERRGQKSLPNPGSLSAIVRSYKSAVSRWAGLHGYSEFGWQARFYDRIIRDENSLASIRLYIIENPHNWVGDTYCI